MVCGRIISGYGEGVCPECKKNLPYISSERCEICSKAIANSSGICGDCRKRKHVFIQGFGLFTYDKTLEKIVAGVKYSKRWKHLEWLTKELAYHVSLYMKRWKPQLVVPVPLHNSRLKKRGFNQAGIIAKIIASEYGIAFEEKLLARKRKTKPQKQLSDDERFTNLKGAFCLNESTFRKYKGLKRVIIVDDIYTTGSTIDMCAEMLRQAGVEQIWFITLCVGDAYS